MRFSGLVMGGDVRKGRDGLSGGLNRAKVGVQVAAQLGRRPKAATVVVGPKPSVCDT